MYKTSPRQQSYVLDTQGRKGIFRTWKYEGPKKNDAPSKCFTWRRLRKISFQITGVNILLS